MGIGIRPVCTAHSSHKSYAVTIHGRSIQTLVTSSRKVARHWIKNQFQIPSQGHQSELLVGLDIEWLPSYSRSGDRNLVAIIQLCISKCCLIFQLHQASSIPKSLYKALQSPNIVYAGVGVKRDAEKLEEEYGLQIAKCIDVATMAANANGLKELKKAGMKTLVEMIMEEEMQKSKCVTLSDWEAETLSCAQVCYTCVDAYYSYKLVKQMIFDLCSLVIDGK